MNSSTSSSDRQRFGFQLRAWLAGFALTALALLGASEWLLRAKVIPLDLFTRHVAYFNATRLREAAFGDSHVAHGFLPHGPIANFAYPSESPQKTAWKIARYLARVPHPRIVLLQADPHLFAAYRLDTGLEDYPAYFDEASTWRPYILSDHYRPQLGALWRSYLMNRGQLHQNATFTSNGGLASPGNLAKWRPGRRTRFITKRLALQDPLEDARSARAWRHYRATVARLRAAGARVCLVSFPISPPYARAIAALPPSHRQHWERAIERFSELGQLPGVSYYDDRRAITDLTLFRDPDHLNPAGAARLTRLLTRQCFASTA